MVDVQQHNGNVVINYEEDASPEAMMMRMYSDIDRDRVRLKKRFAEIKAPTSPDEAKQTFQMIGRELDSTVLSYLKDLAHFVSQQAISVDQLWGHIENGTAPGSDETQFTVDDATRYVRVLTYAKTTLEHSLLQSEITEEQKTLVSSLLEDANYCLANVDENVLEDDDDEGDGADEDEQGPES